MEDLLIVVIILQFAGSSSLLVFAIEGRG